MNMVTLWTSKDLENKDTFDITPVQSINGRKTKREPAFSAIRFSVLFGTLAPDRSDL